jgi:hypothetical protein
MNSFHHIIINRTELAYCDLRIYVQFRFFRSP